MAPEDAAADMVEEARARWGGDDAVQAIVDALEQHATNRVRAVLEFDRTPKILLNTEEAAGALSLSGRTVAKLAAEGELPVVRVGTSLRFPVEGLRQWVTAHTRAGVSGKPTGQSVAPPEPRWRPTPDTLDRPARKGARQRRSRRAVADV